MGTFTINAPNGKSYTIEGENAQGALEALKKHLGETAPPDKYQQAAMDESARLKDMGAPDTQGFTRRLVHGATLGADTTLSALATTPAEMIRHGTFDPTEGYAYAKAREDLNLEEARKKTGILGTATEALGGAVSAGGLASGGVTAARLLPEGAGFLARTAAGGADAAALGGIAGGMEGNGLEERGKNAAVGAGVGFGVGATAPGVLAALKFLASPITSQIAARINPKQYAEAQVARAISEGKMTSQDLELALLHANNEGQGVFTLADALGNPGQRMLSTVARSPGEGRTAVVDALNSRQGDQGRRLSGALREGFDAPQTADQTRQGLVKEANAEANVNYAPVKAETQPIDVSRPVGLANEAISPAANRLASAPSYEVVPPRVPDTPLERARALLNPQPPSYKEVPGAVPTDLAARSGIERSESALRDPIASAVKEARSYLAAPTLTASNVGQAFRAKTNIDQMIAKATENKQGALVAELMPIRDALDEQLARSSQNYAKARDAYRLRQGRIDALDKGKEIGAKPGLPEDAIAQFNPLDAEGKQAFRAGYVDPQISQVQNAAFGTNKARPFTSDAVKQEFDAFASPGRADALQRKIGRENTMFETRNQALGGSRTADNLNDDAAMGVSPEVLGVVKNIIGGNFSGAVKTALSAGKNALTGNTPEVRREVANILLQNGKTIPDRKLQAMVDAVVNRSLRATQIADSLRRGAVGGTVVTVPGQSRR